MAAQLFRELTGGHEDDRRELGRLLHEFEYAVQHRRHNVPLEPALRRLVDWLLPRATPEQIARVSSELPGIIGKLGLSDQQLEDVMKRLCLDRVKDAMVKEGQDVVTNPERAKGPRPDGRKDSGA